VGAGRESKAVFLSYASEDSEAAQLVESMLYSSDFTPLRADARFEEIVRRLHPER
jgi:hypothetical protein